MNENDVAVGALGLFATQNGSFTLSGTDADLFTITTTGTLSFKTAPDFETPLGGVGNDNNDYTLVVEVTNIAGTSRKNITVRVADVNEPPGKPTVTIGTITSTSIAISWEEPTNTGTSITSYELEFSFATGVHIDTEFTNGGARTYTFSNLTPNTEYYIVVSADNNEGFGPDSDRIIATTTGTSFSFNAATIEDKIFQVNVPVTDDSADSSRWHWHRRIFAGECRRPTRWYYIQCGQ